jgi:hypothetical protein
VTLGAAGADSHRPSRQSRLERRRGMGGGDERSMETRMELRSIRPKRATTSLAASVDPTEARNTADVGVDGHNVSLPSEPKSRFWVSVAAWML